MSSAIRDVSETLLELLRAGIAAVDHDQIAVLSPVEAAKLGVRLSLFLYSVTPVAELRNDMEIPGMPGQDRQLSLPLDLYYLLTAFTPSAGQRATDVGLETHDLLGTAMRV